MKIKAKFATLMAACILLFLSLPALARPGNSPQDQGTTQTQSVQKGEHQKLQPGPGKDVAKGGEDIGKGAGKGAESLGKGTSGAAGNLVTLHPGHAAADLGKIAGKKIFGRGGKNKNNSDIEN
jgi:hypothetical protein